MYVTAMKTLLTQKPVLQVINYLKYTPLVKKRSGQQFKKNQIIMSNGETFKDLRIL